MDDSYDLQELGPSNNLVPEAPRVKPSNHLPLDVSDHLERRLKQRHVQMYVHDSAIILLYSPTTHDRIAASL
jgi:hypothetical protein